MICGKDIIVFILDFTEANSEFLFSASGCSASFSILIGDYLLAYNVLSKGQSAILASEGFNSTERSSTVIRSSITSCSLPGLSSI
jgi:hypothetical protein